MKLLVVICCLTTWWWSTFEGAAAAQSASPTTVVLQYNITTASSHTEKVTLKFKESYTWINDDLFNELFPNENCFILTKTSTGEHGVLKHFMSIDFGFDETDRRRLFTTAKNEYHFCIDQFIYLNRMDVYHLWVHSGGPIDGPVEIRLVQVQGKHSRVQEPGRATPTGGWLYYGRSLNYSIESPASDDTHIMACDIISNCHEFDRIKVNDNKTLFHSLPKHVQSLFEKTTPFIRLEIDNINSLSIDSKFKLYYNDANKASISKIKSLYTDSKVTNETQNSFFIIKKVNRKSDKIQIQIPVSSIDLRLQEVLTSISILSGKNSSLRLIGLRHVPNGFAWELPEGINADTAQLNLSTKLFYTLGIEELADQDLADKSLHLDFQVRFDPELDGQNPELDVKIEFKVDSLETIFDSNPKSTLGGLVRFPQESFFARFPGSSIKNSNPTTFTWTSWTYDKSDLRMIKATHDLYTTVDFSYDVSEVPLGEGEILSSDNFQIQRVIFGSRGKHLKITPLKLTYFNLTHVVFHDPIHYTDFPKDEEYFKLGYLTKFVDLDIPLDSQVGFTFHVQKFNHEENCKKVPTFAVFNCDQELFKCPAYFTFEAKQGVCKLNHREN